MDSPFEILDLDPDADDADLDRAYRRRVLETHPDQGGSSREFQRVRAAYEELKADRLADERDASDDVDIGGPSAADLEPENSRVEYLNFEVLDDHGWELTDDDLFEKAADADLSPADYGEFLVEPHESLLEAAENRGYAWPYACRGGACANCAVAIVEGELEMPGDHILSADWLDHGFRLSCNGAPITDEMKVVFNVKHIPGLDELRLPPNRFKRAHLND